MGLINLTRQDGAKTTPGTQLTAFMALAREVNTFPAVEGSATPAEKVTLDGNITFKTGGRFYECYTTRKKSKLDIMIMGQTDSKSLAGKYEFFFPGTGPDVVGLINEAKNSNLIFVVKDFDGNTYCLGDPTNPAELLTVEGGTGMGPEDPKGFVITVECTGDSIKFYNGTISLTPAV